MLLRLLSPIRKSKLSLTKKLKTHVINLRGTSQTPTLRKKISPHLNKSFNCYDDPLVSTYGKQSPLILHDPIPIKTKTKKRIRINSKTSVINSFAQAKEEMNSKNFPKALELLNKLYQEENSIDVLYFRGVCFMHLRLYTDAITDLKNVQQASPLYDSQLYIALYMCYLYINQITLAFKSLTSGIKVFENFSKAFLLRGQLLNKMKKYDQAIKDFKKSDDLEMHFYIAQSLKGKGQYEKELKKLEISEKILGFKSNIQLEKAKLLYRLKRYKEANNILDMIIEVECSNLLAYYYKGKIHIIENEFDKASLLLEQVIQNSHDLNISNRAICKLASIKIKEKYFYEAVHTFNRAFGKFQSKRKRSLYDFTEAVISLMKKKYNESILNFSTIIKENILIEYIQNCYLYRAYAYYAKREYEWSCIDYKNASWISPLDKASEFNYLISQLICSYNEKDTDETWASFKALRGMFPKNPMPEICQICILLNKTPNDNKILKKAEKILGYAMKRRVDSEILYIKSLLYYFQGFYEKSFINIKKCIDRAEEHVYCYYIMRGFCNIALKLYSEAVADFTVAIQLNESIISIYPFRGVCAYLSQEYLLASEDFFCYSKDLKHSSIILSAKLLMFTACYPEALELLINANDCDEVLILKGYCYMMDQDYDTSLKMLEMVKNIDVVEDIKIIHDIIKGKICIRGNGYIFNDKYSMWIKGIALIYEGKYLEAIEIFRNVLGIIHSTEENIFHDNVITEEENCEVIFNIALCNFLNFCNNNGAQENREHALLILKELAEVVNIEHRGQLFLISAILELFHKEKTIAEIMLQESAKCSPEICKKFINGEEVKILPLHTGEEIFSRFELIAFKSFPKVAIRPAIAFPRLQPALEIKEIYDILKSFISFKTISPRPEAPWLNRKNGSIQFTENILNMDIEDSKKTIPPIAFKQYKSQEIKQKQNSFVKVKSESGDRIEIEKIYEKIKEICS